jgi:DNA polymerase (family 10)
VLRSTLERLALLATIRGDAATASLFSRAAAVIQSANIESDNELGPFLEAPPPEADAAMLTQLRYMYEAGAWVLLESAIADLPADLRWLFESGAVTIEQLAALHAALGVATATDVTAELRRKTIRGVSGLDEATETAIATAMPALRSTIARIPLGRALSIAQPVLMRLHDAPGFTSAEPVGSLRRGQELVGDIEIVAPVDDASAAIEFLLAMPDIATVLQRGPRRAYFLIDRVQIGVRCPAPSEAGAALLHLTGSAAHIEKLGAFASGKGFTLEPEGLSQGGVPARVSHSEEAMYHALGLPWIPPEIRDGKEEIDIAAKGSLPVLLTRKDIRGDLHMHTQWSDGRDTTDAMIEQCVALGYEYMAITDHSARAAAARTLTVDNVKKQADEIAGLRERFPNIAILHGCEVDIMADGKLDFPDRVLERFDIVLASLHERHGHAPDQLLRRYVSAMKHPLVSIITHPTNRILPHRPGYELDWDAFFATAIETRTIVEIDGAPAHLDMNGVLARQAIAAGVTVSVDSDCHRSEWLDRQMTMGIMMARRGWVEARHVLNTRPLPEVRAIIAAKRRR